MEGSLREAIINQLIINSPPPFVKIIKNNQPCFSTKD